MSARSRYIIGVDLGGSSVKTAAITISGEVLRKQQAEFNHAVELNWAEKIRDGIAECESEIGRPAFAIGLSAPGIVDESERSIALMPERLRGLVGLDWTTWLGRKSPVRVLNDAHAALLGEVWRGAARGKKHVAMLTLGTGVGGALLLDGKLFRGNVGRAGHLGHMTVNYQGKPDITGLPGSLEDAIGNCTIETRSKRRFATTHDLIAACRNGDESARAIWLDSVRALAVAIASIINIVDPELILVGGGIARAGDLLFEPLREMVGRFEWRIADKVVEILPASQGEFAGAYGAAYHSWKSE